MFGCHLCMNGQPRVLCRVGVLITCPKRLRPTSRWFSLSFGVVLSFVLSELPGEAFLRAIALPTFVLSVIPEANSGWLLITGS